MSLSQFAVIIAAAGRSSRFGDRAYKKPFAMLGAKAVWLHSAHLFHERPDVGQVIVVIAEEDQAHFNQFFASNVAVMGIDVVLGGAVRIDSVRNGLSAVRPELEMVVIHDAARPCLHKKWIDRVFESGLENGAAILATPVTSTIKKSDDAATVAGTVDRAGLYLAQTPQVFRRDLLQLAFEKHGHQPFTDEAQLLENAGIPVQLVDGSPMNIKITTKSDMDLAKAMLRAIPGSKDGGPKSAIEDLFGN